MPGVQSVMTQAKSALASAQLAMNTTSKNVANVNTEGYSRQRVDFQTGVPETYGKHRFGGGVEVAGVTRSVNEFINKRIAEEKTGLGNLDGQAQIYQQLELVFKEEGEAGITGSVSKFFNDLRTLSTQPDSVALRAAVRESASGITTRIQNVARGVDQISSDVNRRIEGDISQVNDDLKKVAQLNKQIIEVEMKSPNTMANDERDARDAAIKRISSAMTVDVTKTENGGITLSSGSMGPLVVGVEAAELMAARTNEGPNPGSVHIFRRDNPFAQPKDVTDRISGGSIGGYFKLRDQTIPEITGKIDNLAYNLASEINSVHRDAYNRNNTNGTDFFTQPTGVRNAAMNLSLSSAIQSDLSNIATADVKNSAADNRALLRMTDLQQANIFEGGKANFVDMTSSIVGKVGAQAKSAYDGKEAQQALVTQLETYNSQASGVSLDEEAIDMLKFQKAFDASAKMIQVADSMMDTVINLKRF